MSPGLRNVACGLLAVEKETPRISMGIHSTVSEAVPILILPLFPELENP